MAKERSICAGHLSLLEAEASSADESPPASFAAVAAQWYKYEL